MNLDSLPGRHGLPLPGRKGMPPGGIPLGLRLIAMLVCTLLAAQLVTLALTVILPPQPAKRWNMAEVVATLNATAASDRLETRTMRGPPDVSGEGWLLSESSSEALAIRLGRPREDVLLAFFTQLPVGGVAVPVASGSPLANHRAPVGFDPASWLIAPAAAQAPPGPGRQGGGAGAGPGARTGGTWGGPMMGSANGFPGNGRSGGSFPGGAFPGSGTFPGGSPSSRSDWPAGAPPIGGMDGADRSGASNAMPRGSTVSGTSAAPSGRVSVLPMPPGGGQGMAGPGIGRAGPAGPQGRLDLSGDLLPVDTRPALLPPRAAGRLEAVPEQPEAPASGSVPALQAGSAPAAAEPATGPAAAPKAMRPRIARDAGRPQPIPFRRDRGSVFRFASPPFIEGDFVAAVRRPDGTWLAVAPRPEAFPNAWQRRIMLWFALSLALISPLAWWMARRIVGPLKDFAEAAEQLGRDPAATILPLSGPAEVGRAAHAFNQMRNRIRAFVDDRTAMVGAISHDLRTPLTRMRFRIECLDEADQPGLLREVTEMEAMISQVIAFIRDASTPGPRERVDFAELVRSAVSDARLVGGAVEIEQASAGLVDVDPVGIRRLLGNLIENAVKYGNRARVRVVVAEDGNGREIVAEIEDGGPGIPEAEFDLAFEPFYRSASAIQSGKLGHGLGLAVCRSIARAHGGDVSFAHASGGFVTRVAMPIAFDTRLPRAA